jgi:TPR repeat protein
MALQKEIDANIASKNDFAGDPVAQFLIGSTVYDSVFRSPSTEDLVEAVTWYRKAAEQGHAEAQFNLGVCYVKGKGVVKDLNVAYAYWSVAGITNEEARNNLARIERQMSADQIADGKKRAAELQKEIDAKNAAKKPGK